MSRICECCGSYAINIHMHGRGKDNQHLCDVCYWKEKAVNFTNSEKELRKLLNAVNKVTTQHRHGISITKRALTNLSNSQLDYEKFKHRG